MKQVRKYKVYLFSVLLKLCVFTKQSCFTLYKLERRIRILKIMHCLGLFVVVYCKKTNTNILGEDPQVYCIYLYINTALSICILEVFYITTATGNVLPTVVRGGSQLATTHWQITTT